VGPYIGHGWKSGFYSQCIGKLLEGMNEVTLLWQSILSQGHRDLLSLTDTLFSMVFPSSL